MVYISLMRNIVCQCTLAMETLIKSFGTQRSGEIYSEGVAVDNTTGELCVCVVWVMAVLLCTN